MTEVAPHYILFAGVNGAGKSTLYKSGLWTRDSSDERLPRVNPDEILVAHGWGSADRIAQLKAAREAVRLITAHLQSRISFNQESTLAGRTIVRTIERAKSLGYRVTLHYVGLADPAVALERIRGRVAHGGHDIPKEDVMRRAKSSVQNLRAVIPVCDVVNVYDNTEYLKFVASFKDGSLAQYEESPKVKWVADLVTSI